MLKFCLGLYTSKKMELKVEITDIREEGENVIFCCTCYKPGPTFTGLGTNNKMSFDEARAKDIEAKAIFQKSVESIHLGEAILKQHS